MPPPLIVLDARFVCWLRRDRRDSRSLRGRPSPAEQSYAPRVAGDALLAHSPLGRPSGVYLSCRDKIPTANNNQRRLVATEPANQPRTCLDCHDLGRLTTEWDMRLAAMRGFGVRGTSRDSSSEPTPQCSRRRASMKETFVDYSRVTIQQWPLQRRMSWRVSREVLLQWWTRRE